MRFQMVNSIIYFMLCIFFIACNNPNIDKKINHINYYIKLQEADSLAALSKYNQACSTLSEIAYHIQPDYGLKYKMINSYLSALIHSKNGNEIRKFSRYWFVENRDTSISYYNELQYFLNYSQSFRIELDFCTSLQYMDSLLIYVKSNNLEARIDTSVIAGNYIDLLIKNNVELNIDSALSMESLSDLSHSAIHCP